MLPKHRSPTHPGEILLEDFLIPMNITQTKLAEHLGWSQPKLSELINGKRNVTPEIALSFADAFGTTPEFWLSLQSTYDLWHALQEHSEKQKLKKVG